MTLTARILLLVMLALAPALAIQVYNEHALRSAREEAVRGEVLRGARALSDDLAQFADGARQILDVLAVSPVIRDRDVAGCAPFLASVVSKLSGAMISVVTDANGTLVCNSRGAAPGSYSLADRGYFQKAMASGNPVLGEFAIGRGTGNPTIQFAAPLKNAEGVITGLINLGYDTAWLSRRFAQIGVAREASLTVVDRNGVILVRLPEQEDWTGRPLPDAVREGYAMAVNAGGVAEMRSLTGTQRITGVIRPKGALEGATVAVGIDRSRAFADIDAATQRGLILILLGTLLAVAAAFVGGRRFIRRPAQRLLAAAHAWRGGDLNARTNLRGASEFGRLGEAFDTMAASLQSQEDNLRIELSRSRDLQQQQVTMLHELNHRVKNTLATVQSLARQSRGGEEQVMQLENRILSLSKTHDLLTRRDWTRASLRQVLENEFEPYRNGKDQFTLIGADVELPPRYVLALGMTAHELTTNAAKYGALSTVEGRVHVDWRVSRGVAGEPRLVINWQERRGPPVAPPARTGFGSRLITGGVARELDGEVRLDFDPEGLRCTIDVPLEESGVPTAH